MIDRQKGRIILQCDSCDDTFEGQRGDEWNDVWAAAKAESWTVKKRGEKKWEHRCGSCGAS
jgi:hypothetical protein